MHGFTCQRICIHKNSVDLLTTLLGGSTKTWVSSNLNPQKKYYRLRSSTQICVSKDMNSPHIVQLFYFPFSLGVWTRICVSKDLNPQKFSTTFLGGSTQICVSRDLKLQKLLPFGWFHTRLRVKEAELKLRCYPEA